MKNILDQLQNIIENGIRNNPVPYRKGNSIRIGAIVIRESKTQGYVLFDAVNNTQISTAYSLAGALAIAKSYMSSQPIEKIQMLDRRLEKHSNDCVFFKHTIKNCSDKIKKTIVIDRYDLAKAEIESINYDLENIIFNS